MNFDTQEALQEFLLQHGIPFSGWGQDSARSVQDLYVETLLGESELEIYNGQLVRLVQVVVALIPESQSKKRFLFIESQTLADGRTRPRNNWPGGKMRSFEDPVDSLIREILEELHVRIARDDISLLKEVSKDEQGSSYPGLRTIYLKRYFITSPIEGLPADRFSRDCENGECQHFCWAPASQLPIPPSDLS